MFDFLVRPFRKKTDGDVRYCRIIKDIFGFKPGNVELYKLALIHKSASVTLPDGVPINNERLEFLGDAVLESIVSDYLFIEFPQSDEGFLTQLRSKIVSRSTLNDMCVKIGLSDHIISQSAGYVQKHLHGDALEAMIGAIYLDKGYDFTNRLIINDLFEKYLDLESMTATETDYKSRLIEWCQKSRHTIHFDTRHDSGSSSHSPKFRSVAVIDKMEMGYGFGSTKKEAEQNAALSVSQFNAENIRSNYLEMLDKAVAEQSSGKAAGRKPQAAEIAESKVATDGAAENLHGETGDNVNGEAAENEPPQNAPNVADENTRTENPHGDDR